MEHEWLIVKSSISGVMLQMLTLVTFMMLTLCVDRIVGYLVLIISMCITLTSLLNMLEYFSE